MRFLLKIDEFFAKIRRNLIFFLRMSFFCCIFAVIFEKAHYYANRKRETTTRIT